MAMIDYDKLREWVQAEISYAIAGTQPGADGYYGSDREEGRIADRLFDELKKGG